MTVEEKAQAVLAAAGTVTALVPASRIRVPGDWQDLTAPYIIHYPVSVSDISTRTHEGPIVLEIYEFYQVSVYAATFKGARAIERAVRAALNGNHAGFDFRLIGGPVYIGRDDRLNLEHVAANFRASAPP